jgi:hypothetical protein
MAVLRGPHAASASELKAQFEAEAVGLPFVVYRAADGGQRIRRLDGERVTVGRRPSAGVPLSWDESVSRLHAELQRVGEDWLVVDDGLSRNGTFVNGERVNGRRRLRDGDTVRCGDTVLIFRDPTSGDSKATAMHDGYVTAASLTETQRRLLVALCRPFKDPTAFATPATNQQIAAELHLSTDAVKGHLRVLFDKFGLSDLPQNEKRLRLVERALHSGAIAARDL